MTKEEQRIGLVEIVSKTIRGTSFVGVRGYENKQGEISNQTFLVGVDYNKAKKRDVAKVMGFDLAKYIRESNTQFDDVLLAKAQTKILSSLQAPNKKQSDAQKESYEHIGNGVKRHIITKDVFVYGFSCKKTILQEGEYPITNSRPLTLAQKELKKAMNLTSAKYRQFKVANSGEVKMRGFDL